METIEATPQMNLAIVGSRELTDYSWFKSHVEAFISEHGKPDLIVSGGARGADTLARNYAQEHQIPIQEFLPNWKLGRHAGILRNTDIVQASTHVLAFPSKQGRGTQDSMKKATEANKILKVIYID